MIKLSAFAFIFVFIILLAFIIICIKEKRFSINVVISALITLAIIVGVGILTFDYVSGSETIITSIKIDDNNSSSRLQPFMSFSDEQENKYWGIGSISRLYYCGSSDVPVRITYLPKTKFVLGIEWCVGEMLGMDKAHKDYRQIYSNGDCWSIACVLFLILIIMCSIPKKK